MFFDNTSALYDNTRGDGNVIYNDIPIIFLSIYDHIIIGLRMIRTTITTI